MNFTKLITPEGTLNAKVIAQMAPQRLANIFLATLPPETAKSQNTVALSIVENVRLLQIGLLALLHPRVKPASLKDHIVQDKSNGALLIAFRNLEAVVARKSCPADEIRMGNARLTIRLAAQELRKLTYGQVADAIDSYLQPKPIMAAEPIKPSARQLFQQRLPFARVVAACTGRQAEQLTM